jgi:hypothetical protein
MIKTAWQNEKTFLTITTIITALCFSAWGALLNNFAIEQVKFSGAEIGEVLKVPQ